VSPSAIASDAFVSCIRLSRVSVRFARLGAVVVAPSLAMTPPKPRPNACDVETGAGASVEAAAATAAEGTVAEGNRPACDCERSTDGVHMRIRSLGLCVLPWARSCCANVAGEMDMGVGESSRVRMGLGLALGTCVVSGESGLGSSELDEVGEEA
jgi:hypothetical protein